MKYLFLDESGDLGYRGSRYFIISILCIENEKELKEVYKLNKSIRRNKFRKELKNFKEIKGNLISESLITHIFKKFNEMNFKIYSIFLHKKSAGYKIQMKNKNDIYVDMVIQLLKQMPMKYFDLKMDNFFPKRQKELYKNKLLEHFSDKTKISFKNSENEIGIQFVDIVAWSTFQKLERKKSELVEQISKNHSIYEYKIK